MDKIREFLARIPLDNRAWRWLGLVGGALAAVALFVAMVIPPLLEPPPATSGPGYDVLALGEAVVTLEAGQEQLAVTQDGRVAVYIPQGAMPVSGRLIVRARRPELVPLRVQGSTERLLAVDLLLVLPDGDIETSVPFAAPALLCFSLRPEERALLDSSPGALTVSRYEETAEEPRWVDLPQAPGWQEGQLCAALEHLSLFALTLHRDALAPGADLPTATPVIELTAVPPDVYVPPGE